MNKKVVILVSAVLAFFAGAIWVSEVPVVATLVAFLEICAGFGCGFFYHRTLVDDAVTETKNEIASLKDPIFAIKEELSLPKEDEIKSVEAATKTVRRASKKAKKATE